MVFEQANAMVCRDRNTSQGSANHVLQTPLLPLGLYYLGRHGTASSGLDLVRRNERSRCDLVLGERG